MDTVPLIGSGSARPCVHRRTESVRFNTPTGVGVCAAGQTPPGSVVTGNGQRVTFRPIFNATVLDEEVSKIKTCWRWVYGWLEGKRFLFCLFGVFVLFADDQRLLRPGATSNGQWGKGGLRHTRTVEHRSERFGFLGVDKSARASKGPDYSPKIKEWGFKGDRFAHHS